MEFAALVDLSEHHSHAGLSLTIPLLARVRARYYMTFLNGRQSWMGMERWTPDSRHQPKSEQDMALLALRIAVGNFAAFLAAVWSAGQRVIVEASLAALLNNAFTVEPAVEADSAAQEQQAWLSIHVHLQLQF